MFTIFVGNVFESKQKYFWFRASFKLFAAINVVFYKGFVWETN